MDLQKIVEEARRKALQKKLKELETAPYFKVEYPMREFVFGYWTGLIPFDEFPDYILNPEGRPKKYDFSNKKQKEEEEYSSDEKVEMIIDHYYDTVDWEVDYELYGLKDWEVNNRKSINRAIMEKYDLWEEDSINKEFDRISENYD